MQETSVRNKFKRALSDFVKLSDEWMDHRGDWSPSWEERGSLAGDEKDCDVFIAAHTIADRSHFMMGTIKDLASHQIFLPIPWATRCLLEAYTDISLVAMDQTGENARRYIAWDKMSRIKGGLPVIQSEAQSEKLQNQYPDITDWRAWAKSQDGKIIRKDDGRLNCANQYQQKSHNPFVPPTLLKLLPDLLKTSSLRSHVRNTGLEWPFCSRQELPMLLASPLIHIATLHTYREITEKPYGCRFANDEHWEKLFSVFDRLMKVIPDVVKSGGWPYTRQRG